MTGWVVQECLLKRVALARFLHRVVLVRLLVHLGCRGEAISGSVSLL